MLLAAKYFWTNNGVIDDPKVNTIIDDGRNYVMASDTVYDVIALEPPLIYTAGVINLFSREFYEDTAARLADDGILLQWIPVGEAPLDDERMLFRAFYDVFPNGTAWQHLWRNGNILLIGSKQPLTIDYQLLNEKFNEPRIRSDMELSSVESVDEILSMLVFDSKALARFVADAAPVTDDNTVLDFSMPRYLGSSFGFAIGTHTPRVESGGKTLFSVHKERTEYYYRASRSAVLDLVDFGEEDRGAVIRRIRSIRRPTGGYAFSRESEWSRWPEAGMR